MSEQIHLTLREVQLKTWNSSLPAAQDQCKGSTSNFTEKQVQKLNEAQEQPKKSNAPYKIPELKITPAASFVAAIGAGTPLSSGEPDPQPAFSRRLKT